jgi:carbamoyltransferase
MAAKHIYVLGINAYSHDVSACLLRDGAIAFAITKERITRRKHDAGFYRPVVDYCLEAEGISFDDLALVVRNSYVLPVPELERRFLSQFIPGVIEDSERLNARSNPLYLAQSDKVTTVSHHLAHAYSAFAACPFERGAIMVVDGVGNYASDVTEGGSPTANVDPLMRESESYYRFNGTRTETLKKVWLKPTRGYLSDDFYSMPGLGAAYSRVSTYIFLDWNKCGEVMGLAPYGRPRAVGPLIILDGGELKVAEWGADFDRPYIPEQDQSWENARSVRHWEDVAWRIQDDTENVLLARARWLREATGEKNLCMAAASRSTA